MSAVNDEKLYMIFKPVTWITFVHLVSIGQSDRSTYINKNTVRTSKTCTHEFYVVINKVLICGRTYVNKCVIIPQIIIQLCNNTV